MLTSGTCSVAIGAGVNSDTSSLYCFQLFVPANPYNACTLSLVDGCLYSVLFDDMSISISYLTTSGE
jgi:hypothetical protein